MKKTYPEGWLPLNVCSPVVEGYYLLSYLSSSRIAVYYGKFDPKNPWDSVDNDIQHFYVKCYKTGQQAAIAWQKCQGYFNEHKL